jgi:hypothetical protein
MHQRRRTLALTTQQIVEQYYDAWRTGDANQFPFAQDFTFDSPIRSVSSPAELRAMASEFTPMVAEVKILDALYHDQKAFVRLEFATKVPQLGSWIALDYFVVEGGQITYSRTIYDLQNLVAFLQSR